ncbi:MAG: hypothetical protein K6F92_07000 [Lachnospiraceae bacterium]|nr:hypothetical protein [Lachnospiraceae bacterium]
MDKYDENLEKLINEFQSLGEEDDTDDFVLKLALKKGRPMKVITIALFALALAGLSGLGFVMNLRPEVSELEKRSLTKFPEFSFETLINGKYFEEISLWYSDTYPYREELIAAQNTLSGYYGIKGGESITGDIKTADEIPESYVATETTEAPEADETTAEDVTAPDLETVSVVGGDTTLETSAATPDEELIPASSPYEDDAVENFGTVYVAGNSAYSMFYFNHDGTNDFIGAVNEFAEHLDGVANVYACVVPTSTGIMLSKEQQDSFGSSDMKGAIDYIYSGLNEYVNPIKVYDLLMAHRDEYIYFRTDHHWTSLGAYYAYAEFADVAGFTPVSLDDLRRVDFDGFLGTYYTQSNMNPALAATPDTVTAYYPNGVDNLVYYNSDLSAHTWPIIKDMTESSPYNKYSTFIAGDHAITIVSNPAIEEETSIIIFKDSFANPFSVFLMNTYRNVFIIDNRYIAIDVRTFCQEHNIKDCIIFYAIDSVSSKNATLIRSNIVK